VAVAIPLVQNFISTKAHNIILLSSIKRPANRAKVKDTKRSNGLVPNFETNG
jgi:hypothetical protein